jgi:uncharacterized membrane protein YgaE (UPF0421/DUF939 family)
VIITQPSLETVLAVSRQRFLGTALGALVGGALASYFGTHVRVFGAGIFLLGLICALVHLDRSGYRFAGITFLIVLLIPRKASPWQIAFHRFAEVCIGICVAMMFALLWPERTSAST